VIFTYLEFLFVGELIDIPYRNFASQSSWHEWYDEVGRLRDGLRVVLHSLYKLFNYGFKHVARDHAPVQGQK
jgi:hypothetical protein